MASTSSTPLSDALTASISTSTSAAAAASSLSSTAASAVMASSTSSSEATTTLQNSSSLLFGFLITVLSLFGIFMVSGMIGHRMLIRRRLQESVVEEYVKQRLLETQRPTLWEVWPENGSERSYSGPWGSMRPLSAQTVHEKPRYDVHSTLPYTSQYSPWTGRTNVLNPVQSLLARIGRFFSFIRLPAELAVFFDHRPPSLQEQLSQIDEILEHDQSSLIQGADIQVAVLIAMPRPSDRQPSSAGLSHGTDTQETSSPSSIPRIGETSQGLQGRTAIVEEGRPGKEDERDSLPEFAIGMAMLVYQNTLGR